jgi:Na+/proline symporter
MKKKTKRKFKFIWTIGKKDGLISLPTLVINYYNSRYKSQTSIGLILIIVVVVYEVTKFKK